MYSLQRSQVQLNDKKSDVLILNICWGVYVIKDNVKQNSWTAYRTGRLLAKQENLAVFFWDSMYRSQDYH